MKNSSLLFLLLFFFSLVGHADDYNPQPLPKESSKVGPAFMPYLSDYYDKELINTYQTLGDRSPLWNNDALIYLNIWKGIWSGQSTSKSHTDLLADADKIIGKGCTDPTIHYLSGICLFNLKRYEEALERFRKAFATYKEKKYPPSAITYCGYRISLAIVVPHDGSTEDLKPQRRRELNDAFDTAQASAIEMLTDPLYKNHPDLCLTQLMDVFSRYKVVHRAFLAPIVTAARKPDVDPWLSNMIQGEYAIMRAWEARGSGYANKVTEAGWAGFRENLASARKFLTAAHALRPDLPQAAASMITVAMGDSLDAPRMWFDRAVAAQFDYQDAYISLETDLMPRWHGSLKELLAFALECAATERFETDVPLRLYSICSNIARNDFDGRPEFWTIISDLIPILDKVFERTIVSQHLSPENAQWYEAMRIAAHVAGSRKQDAVNLKRAFKGDLPDGVWAKFNLDQKKGAALLDKWMTEASQPP